MRQPFGLDGCRSLFELRPEAAFCAHALVENIAKAFDYQHNYLRHTRQKFIASPYQRYPAGGHLHFGTTGTRDLVRFLDYMLVPNVRPVFAPQGWNRRTQGSYGHHGDWRSNDWGFEYRTLPTFLAEKALCLAVFSLAGAIIEWGLEFSQTKNANLPNGDISLENFPKHPAFAKRWPEISYLTFLKSKGLLIRESKDLKETWLPTT